MENLHVGAVSRHRLDSLNTSNDLFNQKVHNEGGYPRVAANDEGDCPRMGTNGKEAEREMTAGKTVAHS